MGPSEQLASKARKASKVFNVKLERTARMRQLVKARSTR
jgi:hypothetical protein